jgi:hypothetical protein
VPYLKLGEADRERLGAPEQISIDLGGITNREAIQLRTLFGFRTPRMWRSALRGQPIDEDGNTVTDKDAKTVADGGPVADYVMDYQAWTAMVWLALKRVGITADPATLEFDIDEVSYEPDPEPEESGKAEEPAEDPAPSET